MRSLEQILKEVESVPDYAGHTVSSVNFKNGWGDTPLHIVCVWGDCEAIKTLVEAGAGINAPGETGFTPLHCAAMHNHADAVRLLLSLGAEIIKDREGHTPTDLAEFQEFEAIRSILRSNQRNGRE